MADKEPKVAAAELVAKHLTGRAARCVGNHVDDFRWLLAELGTGGLTGVFLRGTTAVVVPAVGEDGYTPPVRKQDSNGPATIRTLDTRGIGTRLAIGYFIYKLVKVGEESVPVECFFPSDAASHALDALDQAPNLRGLHGVTHTPIVRADGTILTSPGYDQASGYLYLPTVDVPPVPATPTAAELTAAVGLLRGMVAEFTWVGEHDEANYLGLLLTPLLRLLCPPPYKLGGIMARQPGSGKSLLARIIRDVHGGVFRSELPSDDTELGKTITGILSCTTAPIVQFDNVSGTLRSSRLSGLLTSALYSDRVLGTTNSVDMVNDRLWLITGNNLNFGGDLIRRTLWVTIDPQCPDPQLRINFKLDLPSYVAQHRGEILAALLTLVTAWHAAGMPAIKKSSDDYAHWSAVVTGILTHAGVLGEFDHGDSAQQTVGGDDDGWGEFIAVIGHCFGTAPWTTRNLVDRMRKHDIRWDMSTEERTAAAVHNATANELVDALPAELHDKYLKARESPDAITRSLGHWLRNRNGRWASGRVINEAGRHAASNVALWTVVVRSRIAQDQPGMPGIPGLDPTLTREDSGFYTHRKLKAEQGTIPVSPASPVDLHGGSSPCVICNRPAEPSQDLCLACRATTNGAAGNTSWQHLSAGYDQ